MAKKSMMVEVGDAVKSVAGVALGAAAAVATGVVVGTVAGAMTRGGSKLGEAAPALEKAAADKVSKPILPTLKKRAAAKRKATAAKNNVAAIKAAKTKRTAKRRKR
jgi:hypothetical protein